MFQPISLIVLGSLFAQLSHAQNITYHFTDGSVVTHAVTEVLSSNFEAADMRVYLWDGTIYTWSLSSLANYRFADISTAVTADAFELEPVLVYPNPSAGEVRIGIVADGSGEVEVLVLDLLGGLVATVHRGPLASGAHELMWDGRDAHGRQVADGNYLVRVTQGPRAATRQVTVQR